MFVRGPNLITNRQVISFLILLYCPPMGYPSKTFLPPRSCFLLFPSRLSLSVNQLLALFQGSHLFQPRSEPMFKHSMPVLPYQKCKKIKTAVAGKYFCIALGKWETEKTPKTNEPAVYSRIFSSKVRDHQTLLQPQELPQKAACSLTNLDAVKSQGVFFPKRPREEPGPCGFSIAGRLSPGPTFGHLWSRAREAAWPMIQHCLSPLLTRE